MANRKSSRNQGSQVVAETGLEHPFPACPTRNPRYAIYLTYPADAPVPDHRLIVMNFCGAYAAKHYLDAAIAGHEYKWQAQPKWNSHCPPDTIITDDGVKIKCPGGTDMEDLIEYEMSAKEAAWELPDQYRNVGHMIRRPLVAEQSPEDGGEDRPKRAKREPKPERVKVDKTGLVTVGEIAAQMKVDAKEARGALRKQKVEKPAVGWAWPASMVDDIKAKIKAGLK